MTEQHGIRHDSEADIERGMARLGDVINASPYGSPMWRAAVYWVGRSYAEIERRNRADWGNAYGYMTRDYGDEA